MSEARFALVTGASGGIGRAIAEQLARRGLRIAVHWFQRLDAAESTLRAVREAGSDGRLFQADLADRLACRELIEQVWDWAGRIDLHVQAAGADVLTGEARQLPFDEKLDRLWSVDVAGTVHCCRAMGRRMYEQHDAAYRPSITTIGWDQSEIGMERDAGELFATVKAGVAAFTRSLAHSLAPRVRVNCVAPGWIRTAWGRTAAPHWEARATSQALLNRWGTPQDVAAVVAFLASPDADFINGQVVAVNGGFRTYVPRLDDGPGS